MKKCADYIDGLNDYLDGELDPELCAEIEKHIGECDNCRLMIDSLKMTVKLCRENGQCEDLPKGLSDRLSAKLKKKWEEKFNKS